MPFDRTYLAAPDAPHNKYIHLPRAGIFDFILIDLDLAETFLDIASKTGNASIRGRTAARAAHALNTVLRYVSTVRLSPKQQAAVDVKVKELRARLSDKHVN